jgi:protein SCO1/2
LQTTGLRRGALVLLVSAIALLAAGQVIATAAWQQSAAHDHEDEPPRQREHYSRGLVYYQPPDVRLVDMTGAEVRLVSALNYTGPILLQFIFTTCPTICPVLSGTWAAAQDTFGAELERIRMLSISIDPEHDTPARLQEYAQRFKAKPQWRFLTGKRADLVSVQRAFDVYQGNKMRHQPITFLRASPTEPWVRLNGFMSAAELVAEYRRLMAR